MTPELTALTLAALLQVIQFCAYAVAANLQVGPRYSMGARDDPRQLTGKAGRLQRALNNHFEGLLLFAIAGGVITLSEQSSQVTAICAYGYLAARVLYVPAYVYAWTPGRSLIWFVGFGATVLMLLSALV